MPALRRALMVAVAVVAALAAVAPAARAQVPRSFFGVMVNGPLDAPSFDLDAEAAVMRRAGVGTIRFEVSWDLAEPQPGRYEWAATDRKVLAAARAGIDPLVIVTRTPGWAARTPGEVFSPPRDRATYAAFLRALVARYGPGGALWEQRPGVPRRPVRAWQVWNEPNLPVYFTQQPFAEPYARLLSAGYAAIKRADRGATVVMAGLANFSWRDLATLYRARTPLRFDVAAVHPFSGRPSNSVRIARLNRRVLDRNGARRRAIWLTELTWSSAKGRKQPLTQGWETTERGQAERLRQAYRLYLRARTELRLQRIYWYTWATVDRDSPNSFDYSGLRTVRGDGTVADKPALAAFRAVARSALR
jgi:Beta-galactosidase